MRNFKFSGKRAIGNECGWKIVDSKEGPSKKMKGDQWKESQTSTSFKMSSQFLNENLIQNFSSNFHKISSWKSNGIKLLNDPFQVSVVDNFLSDKSMIKNLVEEIQSMEWTRKQMDLYEFHQTVDLANVSTPFLSAFYTFINSDLRNWMEELTGMKFQKVSASCSMYNCGDFLLSHDDLLTDRLIAYVFYLSPWDSVEKWNEDMGGALELFSSNSDGQPEFPTIHKIFPANNQFAFFKVEKKSHHQVGEVLTKDYPRLTINGWFHGFKDNPNYDADAIKVRKPNVLKFKPPNNEKFDINEIINKSYLESAIKTSIQSQIEENSEAALVEFLKNEFLSKITSELKSAEWKVKGPANQQNFETLEVNSLGNSSNLLKFLNFVASKEFFQLLHEFTELDLNENTKNKPKCRVEFQRWKGGCYTLIGDPSTYQNDTLDLIFYIRNNENVGIVNYLTPEGHQDEETDEEDESVLLTVYPQNNSLNLVYRSSGTTNFTKYCYKSTVMDDEFNYILFCSYKE